jgi:23S rRNA G2069 N7-methylase RlmK/C1962 C5-methylase RlmI
LRELHSHLFSVLESPGLLISSINSANVSAERFESEILQAAQACGRSLKKLRRIEQPPSFPSHPENPKSRYLKGFVFEAR